MKKRKCEKCDKPEFYPDRAMFMVEDEEGDLIDLCEKCLPDDYDPDTIYCGFERSELRHRMETYKGMK